MLEAVEAARPATGDREIHDHRALLQQISCKVESLAEAPCAANQRALEHISCTRNVQLPLPSPRQTSPRSPRPTRGPRPDEKVGRMLCDGVLLPGCHHSPRSHQESPRQTPRQRRLVQAAPPPVFPQQADPSFMGGKSPREVPRLPFPKGVKLPKLCERGFTATLDSARRGGRTPRATDEAGEAKIREEELETLLNDFGANPLYQPGQDGSASIPADMRGHLRSKDRPCTRDANGDIAVLNKCRLFFRSLTQRQLEACSRTCRRAVFPRYASIVREATPSTVCYVLLHGQALVVSSSSDQARAREPWPCLWHAPASPAPRATPAQATYAMLCCALPCAGDGDGAGQVVRRGGARDGDAADSVHLGAHRVHAAHAHARRRGRGGQGRGVLGQLGARAAARRRDARGATRHGRTSSRAPLHLLPRCRVAASREGCGCRCARA